MYCKACGNPTKEGDLFCTKCGAKTNLSEFKWDVYEFREPKKTEEIVFDWSIADAEDDAGIDADLFRAFSNGDMGDQTENAEKFFTFQKKNEEFQKLLDKELEKINKEHIEVSNRTIHKRELNSLRPIEIPEADEPIEPIETAQSIEPSEEEIPELTQENTTITEKAEEEVLTPLWFDQEEQEEAKQKEKKKIGLAGRILLILVLSIIIAELAALGIRYFWPDSPEAALITENQQKITKTFVEWKDQVVSFFQSLGGSQEPVEPAPDDQQPATDEPTQEPTGKDDPETPPAPDPNPVADKAVLIEGAKALNQTIEVVRPNNTLQYIADHDYGVKDVNNSKPLGNNIWMETEPEGVLYYDQSLVSTLVAFDSQWIQYVNDGSKDVINLVKANSRAYDNVTGYSNVGKVNQKFKLLEIGEIRQGETGYYVWTYEEIEQTVGKKTTLKKYHWIYYLEPVEGEMRIVDYFYYGA